MYTQLEFKQYNLKTIKITQQNEERKSHIKERQADVFNPTHLQERKFVFAVPVHQRGGRDLQLALLQVALVKEL